LLAIPKEFSLITKPLTHVPISNSKLVSNSMNIPLRQLKGAILKLLLPLATYANCYFGNTGD
jgi:hypothetical protein